MKTITVYAANARLKKRVAELRKALDLALAENKRLEQKRYKIVVMTPQNVS